MANAGGDLRQPSRKAHRTSPHWRAEIDDAVRKANALVNEINRKWPFARDPEVKLP